MEHVVLQQGITEWQQEGQVLLAEDIARLPPLLHEYINMLGRYDCTLPVDITAERLRQLWNLDSWQERSALAG